MRATIVTLALVCACTPLDEIDDPLTAIESDPVRRWCLLEPMRPDYMPRVAVDDQMRRATLLRGDVDVGQYRDYLIHTVAQWQREYGTERTEAHLASEVFLEWVEVMTKHGHVVWFRPPLPPLPVEAQ